MFRHFYLILVVASAISSPIPALHIPETAAQAPRQADFSPEITYPTASVSWPIGSTQDVTWDISNLPPGDSNRPGLLLLGYEDGGSNGENLDLKHPLAQNFVLGQGQVSITVPNVTPMSDYIVVLMGNSGNASPLFSIAPSSALAEDLDFIPLDDFQKVSLPALSFP